MVFIMTARSINNSIMMILRCGKNSEAELVTLRTDYPARAHHARQPVRGDVPMYPLTISLSYSNIMREEHVF